MKRLIITSLALIIISCFVYGQKIGDKGQGNEKSLTDSIDGVYIPINLEDCFKQINGFWNDSTKAKVKNWSEDEFVSNAHFGFGMWMRNNWHLWGGSRLSKYFNDLGVFHPDDMSSIILTSYHRYLIGEDIKLQEQIDYFKAYWLVNKEPEKNIYPEGVNKIEFNNKILYNLKENNIPGCIHVQTNSKTDSTWIYDYHFGWKVLTKEELGELREAKPDKREEVLLKLFNNKN